MRIMHNITSLNTHNRLKENQKKVGGSLEKLASGLQINRASDNAAGLAISEKMRGQIRGLNMAGKNIQDGISLVQTAEGALDEVSAILQRARELVVQAANDTNVEEDREAIQKEITHLVDEVDRIAETTEFNAQKLFQVADEPVIEPEEAVAPVKAVQMIEQVTVAKDENYGLTKMKSSKDGGLLGVYNGIAGKFDENGTREWAFSLANKKMNDLIETSDNHYLVLYTDLVSSNNSRVHMAKLDQSQNIVWDSQITNTYITDGVQLIESGNGDYLLGANGSGIQNSDVILSRVSTTGQILQTKTFGSPQSNPYAYGSDKIEGMVETKNGDIFVYGSNVLKNNNVYSNEKTWVAKLDNGFTLKWDHVDGAATGGHSIKDAVATDDGGIIAVGNYQDGADNKGFMYKLNANGQKEWEKILHQSYGFGSIVAGEDGQYFVGGDTDGDSTIFVFDGKGTQQATVILTDTGLQGTVSELVQRPNSQFVASSYSNLSIFDVPELVPDDVEEVTAPLETVIKTKQLILHTGANEGQNMNVTLRDISSESLNLHSLNVLQHDLANDSIPVLDQAIDSISSFRSDLGAVYNRLEHAYEVNMVSAENLQAAESTIRDTDMAKEMMRYTKQSILASATQSMLAQANQQPSGVLALLS